MSQSRVSRQKKTVSGKTKGTRKSRSRSGSAAGSKRSSQNKRVPGRGIVDRAADALRRLGVTELQLQTCPQITGILKQSYGGLPTVLQAMRFSEDENIKKFLKVYDTVPLGDALRLPWEAVMLKAGVDPTYLLGAVMLAVQNHSANTVKMIALSNHSKVMRRRIQFAQLPGGHRDRDALDTILGALPSPKGPTFIGSLTINKPKPDGEEEPERDSDVDHLFPSPGEVQVRLTDIRQRLLTEKV